MSTKDETILSIEWMLWGTVVIGILCYNFYIMNANYQDLNERVESLEAIQYDIIDEFMGTSE